VAVRPRPRASGRDRSRASVQQLHRSSRGAAG
jgi:hypothetical protein